MSDINQVILQDYNFSHAIRACCVSGCNSVCESNKNNERSFFQFPQNNDMFQKWVGSIGSHMNLTLFNSRKNKYICDLHFEPQYICDNPTIILVDGIEILKPRMCKRLRKSMNPVPTLFSSPAPTEFVKKMNETDEGYQGEIDALEGILEPEVQLEEKDTVIRCRDFARLDINQSISSDSSTLDSFESCAQQPKEFSDNETSTSKPGVKVIPTLVVRETRQSNRSQQTQMEKLLKRRAKAAEYTRNYRNRQKLLLQQGFPGPKKEERVRIDRKYTNYKIIETEEEAILRRRARNAEYQRTSRARKKCLKEKLEAANFVDVVDVNDDPLNETDFEEMAAKISEKDPLEI